MSNKMLQRLSFLEDLAGEKGQTVGEFLAELQGEMNDDSKRYEEHLYNNPEEVYRMIFEEIDYYNTECSAFPEEYYPVPDRIVEVLYVRYKQEMRGHETIIGATCIVDDAQRYVTYYESKDYGSYWDPPDTEINVAFDELPRGYLKKIGAKVKLELARMKPVLKRRPDHNKGNNKEYRIGEVVQIIEDPDDNLWVSWKEVFPYAKPDEIHKLQYGKKVHPCYPIQGSWLIAYENATCQRGHMDYFVVGPWIWPTMHDPIDQYDSLPKEYQL